MQLDPATAQAVSAALLRICQRNVFFGALALFARVEASDTIPTAATDGRDVFVNPAFLAALNADEQEALLLHEVLHAALLHVPRSAGRDPKLWNIAADIVINGMLAHEGYQLPAGGLRDQRLEQYGVEEVYAMLQARKKAPPELSNPDLLGERPADATALPSEGVPHDREVLARGAAAQHWDQAHQQARMLAEGSAHGSLPAQLEREFGQVGPGVLDWRSRLWRYLVRTPTDFGGFDRRFVGRELYLEALDAETVSVSLAVDTSGSIDQDVLALCMGEVQRILGAYPHLRCDLYYADAELHGPYRITARSPVPPPIGGGGTDFRPFFAKAEQQARRGQSTVAIYLTDGYGQFPQHKPRIPTLWVVTPGGQDLRRFPFGEAVRLVR